jgi:hypothetical protein
MTHFFRALHVITYVVGFLLVANYSVNLDVESNEFCPVINVKRTVKEHAMLYSLSWYVCIGYNQV